MTDLKITFQSEKGITTITEEVAEITLKQMIKVFKNNNEDTKKEIEITITDLDGERHKSKLVLTKDTFQPKIKETPKEKIKRLERRVEKLERELLIMKRINQ